MRRTRARVLATTVVGTVAIGSAYADLTATPTTAQSQIIPANTAGEVVFSLRNNTSGSVIINGFTPMAPSGSSGEVDACANLAISPPTATTLSPGQQAQFTVNTASGFPGPAQYACIYQPITNPAMVPLPQVTAIFQVFSAPPNSNVQPTLMDFGTQGSGSFELQTLYFTNYSAATSGTQLTITNDPTQTIVFGGTCNGMQSCFIGGLATNATGSIPIECRGANGGNPTATIDVTGTGSGFGSATFFGSMQATCMTPSFGTLSISPPTIVLSGPANQQTVPIAIMVDRAGSGSAVLTSAMMMGDPSLGIVECGGASCSNLSESFPATLNVYCTPQAGGSTGSLFVTSSNGEMTSATVDCNQGSGGAAMTVNPPFINFPGTVVNASQMSMITIGNQGGTQLDGVEVAVGGIDPGDFSVSPCAVGNPCSIGSNSSQDVMVTFTPQGVGARSGLLTVTNTNDLPDSGQTVTLDGSGEGATMSVLSPAGNDLDFNTIPRGQAVTLPITIGDTGNTPITATITGVSPPYTVDMGTITVPAGGPGSNSFNITCQSSTASQNNDQTFTITSPDAYAGSPQTVTVHCAIANSQLTVNPNPIHFLEHRVGSPEATIDVTLSNPGSAAPATITHVQLASAKTGLSLSPPDTMTTLPAGSNAHVTLDLETNAETDLAGENLDVTVDGELIQVQVDGKVVTPGSRIAPESLDLGTACVGTQVSGTVSLINTGTATLNLADAPTMDQNFTASFVMPTTYPSTLAPGATAVTTVSPAMSASGMVTGTLEWKDDVPNDYHVPVTLEYVASGTAISPAALDFGSIEVGSPGSSQQITIQNCDAVPAQVKVRSLRATSGPIGAWTISPMIGNAAQLGAKGVETVTAHFDPPGRGRYEAELSLDTPTGIKTIKLLGDATGRDLDDTSVYACSCSGGSAGGGWPIGLALVVVVIPLRRRRGSSSPR